MHSFLTIDPWAFLFAALLSLTLPIGWLAAAFLAAVVHELFHIMAIIFMGSRIVSIHIQLGGTVIESEISDKRKELISTLAGPTGSLLLIIFCHWFPRLSICGAIQGAFNLLPIQPLDGGHALRCTLEILKSKRYDCILTVIEFITCIAVAIAALIGMIWFSMGILPLFTGIVLIIKAILRKRPCKRSQIKVQ